MSKENDDIFNRLDQCYKQGRSVGFHLIIAGDGSNLSSMSQPFMQQLKSGQRGFVFTSAADNASLLGARVQRVPPKNILPGRAFLVQPNGPRLMQIAQFEPDAAETADLNRWLKQCQERSTPAAEAQGANA